MKISIGVCVRYYIATGATHVHHYFIVYKSHLDLILRPGQGIPHSALHHCRYLIHDVHGST